MESHSMSFAPETRPSLIARLQTGADDSAWDEFVAIYRPVIVRLAAKLGLQHSDAEDVAQGVLLSVSNRIAEWKFDPQQARFRTWLQRIVRNSTINALVRRPADRGAGGTTAFQSLNGVPNNPENLSAQLEIEWRREAFRWASDEVRNDVHPATWEAFWLTAVEGIEVSEVAKRAQKTIGAVYVARCRVMQKVQAKIRELTGEDAPEDPLPDERPSP
jgi:RNA polymerase sigma-70 factor (ECF subfamily)